MYVNTFICLEENISGYGMNKKAPNGHVTIMTPGMVRCYVQNLAQIGKPFVLYLLSKKNNKAIRVGEINPIDKDKETRWKTDINNMFNCGIKGNEIDAAAIVVEGDTAGNTDAILTGFMKEQYLMMPLLEKAVPKKTTMPPMQKEIEKKVIVEIKPIPKAQPKVAEVKEVPKAQPKVVEIKEVPKAQPKVVIVKEQPKEQCEVVEVKVLAKEEPKATTAKEMVKEEPKVVIAKEMVKEEPKVVIAKEMVKEEPKVVIDKEMVKEEPKVVVVKEVPKEEPKLEKKIEHTDNEEDILKEKIKKLLEDQLKETLNGIISKEKIEKVETPAPAPMPIPIPTPMTGMVGATEKKEAINLEEMIKEQLQQVLASESKKMASQMQQQVEEKPEVVKNEKEEEKIDFCEECEDCTETEKEYLGVVDQQLRALEQRLNDTRVQIINIRKEYLNEDSDDARGIFTEDIENNGLEDYLDYTRVEEIFATSDAIYPFEGEEETVDWVRISLSELMSIPQLSYEWCANSCITFCAHKYGHLVLGKDRSMKQYYIGIPDQYHPARRSMLATDRVEKFICCKNTNPRVGEYGYWIINI